MDELRRALLAAGLDQTHAGRYRHFKGGTYTALGTLLDADTDRRSMVYVADADGVAYVRDLASFLGPVPDRAPARFSPMEGT